MQDRRAQMNVPTLRERASGVLLHPTCLPGAARQRRPRERGTRLRRLPGGCGAALVADAARSGPPGYGESPYSAQSAFAGQPAAREPRGLADGRPARPRGARAARASAGDRVDYPPMEAHRIGAPARRLRRRSRPAPRDRPGFRRRSASDNASWLDDFALFRALKRAHGGVQWTRWDERRPTRASPTRSTPRARSSRARWRFEKFVQFAFDRQWQRPARVRGRRAASASSATCPSSWRTTAPTSGRTPRRSSSTAEESPRWSRACPPTTSARTGQRWGNPLYRWRRMKKDGYAWWIARLRSDAASLRRRPPRPLHRLPALLADPGRPSRPPCAAAG